MYIVIKFRCKSTKSVSLRQNQSAMNDNLFAENLKNSAGYRIFLYLIILMVSSLLGMLFSLFFISTDPFLLKVSQGISSTMMFIVPPIVYYCLSRKEQPMTALGFRKIYRLMFVSLPITNQLSTWNEGLKLSGTMQRIENWMKTLEESAATLTEKMLKVETVGGLLFNLLIIALIPAIGEELTFRGILQQSLTRSMKNPHVAIILSAAIFSFIHFQFYGFLPRMFLGILLGYMFYVSGSIWTSITMHFVNNGTAVVLYYLNNKETINIDADHFGETQSVWILFGSALLTSGLIAWCWIKEKRTVE